MRAKFFIVIFLLSAIKLFAQENDFELRPQIGLKYTINKKSELSLSSRLDFKENASQFRRTNINLSYDRKLNKWLDVEIYYRFMTNYNADVHRFRIGLSTDKKLAKKTYLQYRSIVQHDIKYFDLDYLARYKPNYYWRNRILLKYKYNKKISFGIYTEPFIQKNYLGWQLSRMRYGAKASYDLKKWTFNGEYFLQRDITNKNVSNSAILCLSAQYDITRMIRPKKKKK